MKKRLLSLLLVLCMMVALFASMGTTASAASDTFTYTIKSGDTLWGLCRAKGLNYYTCKAAIMTLNGFTSDYQLSHISVGDTITLPSSDAIAQKLSANGSTTTTTTTTTTGSTTTSTTTTVNALANGDVVSYYLVAHTMASGETTLSIYNGWKLNYKTYSDQILAINGLKSFNKMYAGRSYLFPVPVVPAGATAAYSVIAHKVASGDSAYNLCNTYNTNYNKSLTVVKAVNNGSDLTSIKSGQVVYIPATGNVGTTTTTGGNNTSGGTTGGATGGTTGGATSTTAYDIKSLTSKNGSFITKIGSSAVTTAKSGSSVSIVTTPAAGYVVDSIVVSKADDASTTVATNSSVFTMPAYAVNVKVTFKLASTITSGVAHKINITATNGKASAIMDGSTVTTAKAGSFISLNITPDTGYQLDNVKVSYNNYASNVPVSSNAFNMPDYDVNVVVTFKTVPTYNITALATKNGTFSFKADGVAATKAAEGQTVTISTAANANYALDSINVTFKDGTAVSMIDSRSFIMPAQAVRVAVTFKGSYPIVASTAKNGSYTVLMEGRGVNRAVAGKTVDIVPKANNGYIVSAVQAFTGSKAADMIAANEITVSGSAPEGPFSFEMPNTNVIVKVTFAKVSTYAITDTSNPDEGSLKFKVNGSLVTEAAEGTVVTIVPTTKDGYKLDSFSVSAALDKEPTVKEPTFVMPGEAIDVSGVFNSVGTHTVTVKYNANRGTPSLSVDGKKLSPLSNAQVGSTVYYEMVFDGIYEGKTATVSVECKTGFALGKVTATNSADEAVAVSDADSFEVKDDLNVALTFRGLYYSIMSGTPANGSFELVDANGQQITNTASAGSMVYIKPTPNSSYKLDKIKIAYLNADGSTKTKAIEKDGDDVYKFQMPSADVTLTVTFKASVKEINSVTLVDDAGSGCVVKLNVGGKRYTCDETTSFPLEIPVFTTVKIEPVITKAGFSVSNISIVDATSKKSLMNLISYNSEEMSFVMPADYDSVDITVTVVADA